MSSTEREAESFDSVRRSGERRVFDALLKGGAILVSAVMLAEILSFSYGRDQGIYAMVAKAILEGKMPYRDAWDFKPPGIYVVYAFARAVFGAWQGGVRVLEVLGLAAMGAAMVRLSRIFWDAPRAGFIAAAVAIAVHAELDFWHTAQPESFGGMVTIFALLAVAPSLVEPRADDRRQWWRWLFAGALFGFAGLLKPPLGGGAVVLATVLGRRLHGRGTTTFAALRPAFAMALGGALPLAACLAWFAAKGALGDLYRVLFVFTPHYTSLSWQGQSLPRMLYWGVTEWLVAYSSLTAVGLVLFAVLRPHLRDEKGWDAGTAAVAGLIAVHIVGVTMQGKFFPYHYGATWPLTALLAGLGYERVYRAAAARGPTAIVIFFMGFMLVASLRNATRDLPGSFGDRLARRAMLFVLGERDQRGIDELASVADVNAVANRSVAEWIGAHTQSDRPIFIFGFEPVIYDLARRAPASRYLYDVPQRVGWAKSSSRDELMADLGKSPPSAIVVEHGDVFPAVTGDSDDSAESLYEFFALEDLLARRYRLAQTIEDFDIYLEVDPAGE